MLVRSSVRIHFTTFCVILVTLVKYTTPYSTGAPTMACADVTPGHGFQARTDPAPFLVEVSKTQYAPNERIYVRIRACGASKFKGFIIQPRSAVYPERPAFLGAFLRVQGTRYECVRSGAVLTHSNSDEKQSVTMTWIAPPAAAGHVVFRVTVVQDYRTYWVGINSPVVYDGVSRDLTMMQAFILQSPTDKTCLPGRKSATTTTESIPQTTTEDLFVEATTTFRPTTTRTMRTTDRPTTTRRPTTTLRTTPLPRTTPAATKAPTTTAGLPPTDIFYDYVWDTSTARPTPTTRRPTTTARRTTTRRLTTTTPPRITTTEYIPPIMITTTPVFEPTTTVAPPPPPTTTLMIDTTTIVQPTTEQLTDAPTTPRTTTTTTQPPPPPTTTTIPPPPTTTTTTPPPPTTTTTPPPPPPTTTTLPLPSTTTTRRPIITTQQEITPGVPFQMTTEEVITTTTRPTVPPTLPTTLTMPTTVPDMVPPTTTSAPPPAPTTLTQRQTTYPVPTTTFRFEVRNVTAPVPDTTVGGLREQFNQGQGQTSPLNRSPDNKVQQSTPYFPDYYDSNAIVANAPSFYDIYGDFGQPDTGVPVNNPPFSETPSQPFVPSNIKEQSSTAWVPTRDWNMPTQYPISTDSVSRSDIMFNPPETPAITRTRLPYSTTTAYIPTPSVTVKSAPEPQPTVRGSEVILTPDPACGVTQGCFDDCSNGICNFIVSWVPEKEKTVFEIRTKPRTSGQYWAAIGFSDDKMMGLDSVTECITEGDNINVYQSYNLDYYRNMRLLTPNLGVLHQSGMYRDGLFECKFTRENYVAGEKDVFDLSKNWHMMFAEGPAVNGIKIPHRYDSVPPVSKERVDLQQYPPVHETYDYRGQARTEVVRVVNVTGDTLTPLVGHRIAADKECGSSRSCFQDCTSAGCHFIVSWSSQDDYVTFKTRAQVNETSSIWIAIAFSDDKDMGDDSVVQCVADGNGEIDIRHSFNNGKNNVRIENAEVGLINRSASLIDGVFECEFVRQRHVGDYEHIYNLDKKWNILFAHGKSKKGIMLPHSLDHKPHVTDNAVDFRKSAPSHITASTFFIKIHATVMIFAWILCASVASVVGRYFQPYWWGEKMLGSKVWVKVHWLFVLITCASVIGGFTVIFIGVDGISKLYEHPDTGFNGTHPIMGLIVTLLALLNPLLLCLKPSEDSSGRAFFNCLYWLVEIGAHVLAVVTIYAGFGLTSDIVPSFFTYLLIGFAVYQILILLFMEALKSFDAKKTIEKKKVYLYEMQIRPWHSRKNNSLAAYMDLNHTSKALKQTAFATHLLLLSALTTTMVVIILIGYH